jgi:hypothetical protein
MSAESLSDPVMERAAATVRRYLADPKGCETAIQKLMAQLRAGPLSKNAKN